MESKTLKLTPMEVLAVIAFHVHRFTINEVAEWLDIPIAQAQNHIYRGSAKLRRRGLPRGN